MIMAKFPRQSTRTKSKDKAREADRMNGMRPFSNLSAEIGRNSELMNNSLETDQLSPKNLSSFDPNQNFSPQFIITGANTKVSFKNR